MWAFCLVGFVKICRCYADGEYTQAMGIALEARRLDKVEETIQQAADKPALLKYTFDVCQTLVTSRDTRLKVLAILVAMHRLVPEPDHVAVCQCLQFLGEVSRLVSLYLSSVLSEGKSQTPRHAQVE